MQSSDSQAQLAQKKLNFKSLPLCAAYKAKIYIFDILWYLYVCQIKEHSLFKWKKLWIDLNGVQVKNILKL